jgi:hypothetical protein
MLRPEVDVEVADLLLADQQVVAVAVHHFGAFFSSPGRM